MKKERIKKKAEELFRLYGVRSVTMDEISSQLGISKKTLYHSFDDKSDLVDEVARDMLDENIVQCKDCREKAANAIEELFKALEVIEVVMADMNPSILYDLEKCYPKSFQRFQDYRYDFLYGLILENIRWGKEDGLFRPEIHDEIFAKARLEMITLSFNEMLFPKSRFTVRQIQRELMMLFLHSMVTPKGLKLIEKYSQAAAKKKINP